MSNKLRLQDIALYWGVTERAIKTMKQKHLNKFKLLELGSICNQNGINKEDLINLIEVKNLIRTINSNKQQTEN